MLMEDFFSELRWMFEGVVDVVLRKLGVFIGYSFVTVVRFYNQYFK